MALSRACMSLSLRRAWIEMSRPQRRIPSLSSRSPYGERGLKSERSHSLPVGMRRSPYGERGLKYAVGVRHGRRPGRSPYGERGLKFTAQGAYPVGSSRSPYGERGLKYRNYRNCAGFPCRSPYGERGLKLGVTVYAVVFGVSLFLRRAWIEMSLGSSYLTASLCRSPYGECGLK